MKELLALPLHLCEHLLLWGVFHRLLQLFICCSLLSGHLFVVAMFPDIPLWFLLFSLLGGQLFFLGFIGEYLGRVFNENKFMPLYLVQDFNGIRVIEQRGTQRHDTN